ncbi:MAG: pyruvate kinase [Acholeplasmataceae bacterium]|jgi:pyruvate kinase
MYRKTKIVCTIGPASESPKMIEKLILAGMNVARLNFSHGTHEEHMARINTIREVSKKMNRYVGILLDTKGPEIRTGEFEGGKCAYKKGDVIKIFAKERLGNKEGFHIPTPELFHDINVNDYILVDDGKIRLNVLDKQPEHILVEVMNNGVISNRKGINTPGVHIGIPFISKKDAEDIEFAVKADVDMIALSFVRTREDVNSIRSILRYLDSGHIELISKIESQGAVENLDEILDVSDGIMVARGDLGVEVSLQLVPLYQKKMITKANEHGKPVITATHMLESMIHNPRPTRAEASDVANAILDGSDAIMLSGETAAGEYPVESVQTMDIIAKAIEQTIDYNTVLAKAVRSSQATVNDAIGSTASQIALMLPDVKAIVAFTETGGTPKRLCKFRPSVPTIAITKAHKTCTRLTYYWGVLSIFRDDYTDFLSYDRVANEVVKELGFKVGDKIVITSGYAQQHGSTNTLRIIEVK